MSAAGPSANVDLLYRRFAPVVLRRALAFFDAAEAEEVMHEVFLKTLEKGGFEGRSSPVTWLYRVTTNACLNRIRDRDRRRDLLAARRDELAPLVRGPVQEDRAFLGELWRTLDPELAQIGVYYYVDGMTHDQIAEVVECSPATVRNRLAALKRAAKELEER